MGLIRRMFGLVDRLYLSREERAKKAGVEMGTGNQFFSDFWSSEPYLIKVGSHCQITAGVHVFTHGGAHVLRCEQPDFDVFGRVTIGDWVYIGNNALIMPGVTIGNKVLIAAGSVVTKSVPPNCVVAGNPARYICSIDEYRLKNEKYNTHSKTMNAKEKERLLLMLPEENFVSKRLIITPPRKCLNGGWLIYKWGECNSQRRESNDGLPPLFRCSIIGKEAAA